MELIAMTVVIAAAQGTSPMVGILQIVVIPLATVTVVKRLHRDDVKVNGVKILSLK